jgi:hypothetical protein
MPDTPAKWAKEAKTHPVGVTDLLQRIFAIALFRVIFLDFFHKDSPQIGHHPSLVIQLQPPPSEPPNPIFHLSSKTTVFRREVISLCVFLDQFVS